MTAQTHTENRTITDTRPLRAAGWAYGLTAAAVLLALDPHVQMHALNAAGAFKGEAIGGIANFVDKLKGNLVWLGGTAMGLVIAVVGIMFMAGHSRAHDIAIRTIAGLAILASISGIVA
ncbi:MAG TPA: hypothetical protein VII01_08185 [Solirubrobacteraceae bacterium]